MFIIHNHIKDYPEPNVLDIGADEKEAENVPLFSAGIHPKLIDKSFPENFAAVTRLASHPHCAAIGECGIDIFSSVTVEEQKEAFMQHLRLAQQYAKPVIIHCVRAYSEIISALNAARFQLPVVMHSYNGNIQTTQQLLRRDNIYFSFSDKILATNCAALKSLDTMSAPRLKKLMPMTRRMAAPAKTKSSWVEMSTQGVTESRKTSRLTGTTEMRDSLSFSRKDFQRSRKMDESIPIPQI